jgi:uncharacterized protein YegP (UPF0339 family)
VAAKFVLKKGSTGKFRFNLVAANGEIVATSEAYESKSGAKNGIEAVRRRRPQTWSTRQSRTSWPCYIRPPARGWLPLAWTTSGQDPRGRRRGALAERLIVRSAPFPRWPPPRATA